MNPKWENENCFSELDYSMLGHHTQNASHLTDKHMPVDFPRRSSSSSMLYLCKSCKSVVPFPMAPRAIRLVTWARGVLGTEVQTPNQPTLLLNKDRFRVAKNAALSPNNATKKFGSGMAHNCATSVDVNARL